jgi:hypothetical protein
MKKTLIGLSLLVIVASCKPKNSANQQGVDTITPLDTPKKSLMSLNGFTADSAKKCIANFQSNPGSYTAITKTNIWFTKTYVHDVRQLLDNNGYDGIRVYFAKTNDGKYNFVIVPTKDNGARTDTPHLKWHKDYYENKAFLYTSEVNGVLDYGSSPGAILYQYPQGCPMTDNCPANPHHLPCGIARQWVNSFSVEPIDSKAEWYEKSFIENLDDELQDTTVDKTRDGLRIYYAKHNSNGRTCFVVVTTKNNGQDYFGCFESKYHGAGDKGELCPTSCDPPPSK